MRGRSLIRLFWMAAAATLVVAAAIALVAVVAGHFDETDGKILATLGTALLAGACATAAGETASRRLLGPLPPLLVAGCVVAFGLSATWIWKGFGEHLGRAAGSCYLLLAVELLVVTNRLLARRGARTFLLFLGTTLTLAVATTLTLAAIWSNGVGSSWAKVLATFWILAALGYLLTPVLGRLEPHASRTAAQKVDLSAGVRIGGVTVRRLTAGGEGRSSRELLYVVEHGTLVVAGVELAAGEAALVPAHFGHEPIVGDDGAVLVVGAALPS